MGAGIQRGMNCTVAAGLCSRKLESRVEIRPGTSSALGPGMERCVRNTLASRMKAVIAFGLVTSAVSCAGPLKLEMPGAQEGVDVYPGAGQALDFPKYASRLKRFGTAYRAGDQAMVTRVKLKNDLIEFQLGGGGYGTFGDDANSYVGVPLLPKTEREKNLEKDVQRITNPAQQRRIREELDALRRDRQREDVRNQAEALQAQHMKDGNIRQRRTEGGSRFNIRYKLGVPGEAITPEAVMRALEQYVDFASLAGSPAAQDK